MIKEACPLRTSKLRVNEGVNDCIASHHVASENKITHSEGRKKDGWGHASAF